MTKVFPDFACKDDAFLRRCSALIKFKNHPGILGSDGETQFDLVFVKDKLVNIDVMWIPQVYDYTYKEFVKIFGQPLSDTAQKIRTDDGRKFENHVVIWSSGGTTVEYYKYYENVGISRIVFMLKDK